MPGHLVGKATGLLRATLSGAELEDPVQDCLGQGVRAAWQRVVPAPFGPRAMQGT